MMHMHFVVKMPLDQFYHTVMVILLLFLHLQHANCAPILHAAGVDADYFRKFTELRGGELPLRLRNFGLDDLDRPVINVSAKKSESILVKTRAYMSRIGKPFKCGVSADRNRDSESFLGGISIVAHKILPRFVPMTMGESIPELPTFLHPDAVSTDGSIDVANDTNSDTIRLADIGSELDTAILKESSRAPYLASSTAASVTSSAAPFSDIALLAVSDVDHSSTLEIRGPRIMSNPPSIAYDDKRGSADFGPPNPVISRDLLPSSATSSSFVQRSASPGPESVNTGRLLTIPLPKSGAHDQSSDRITPCTSMPTIEAQQYNGENLVCPRTIVQDRNNSDEPLRHNKRQASTNAIVPHETAFQAGTESHASKTLGELILEASNSTIHKRDGSDDNHRNKGK